MTPETARRVQKLLQIMVPVIFGGAAAFLALYLFGDPPLEPLRIPGLERSMPDQQKQFAAFAKQYRDSSDAAKAHVRFAGPRVPQCSWCLGKLNAPEFQPV
jgi:hypothetical protein